MPLIIQFLYILEFHHNLFLKGITSFPVVAGFHSSPLLGSRCLQQLHDEVSRINVKKLHRFLTPGLEEDDLLSNRNSLADSCRSYSDY